MESKLPFKIFYKNTLIANIISYGYETPWASGKAIFEDPSLKEKLATAWDFINDEEDDDDDESLSVEESNRQYQEEIDNLGIQEALNMLEGENWSIILADGEIMKIYSPIIDDSGYIEWRF